VIGFLSQTKVWPADCTITGVGTTVIHRLEPLLSGRETEIDMIEREMEGGVVIIQPLELHEDYVLRVHQMHPMPLEASKG